MEFQDSLTLDVGDNNRSCYHFEAIHYNKDGGKKNALMAQFRKLNCGSQQGRFSINVRYFRGSSTGFKQSSEL